MPDDVTVGVATSPQDGRHFDASFVTSVFWTGVAKSSSQLISWLATFLVARLLTPEDYGLVGMATVFLGVVTIVSEFGLGITIVTLRELSERQIAQLNTVALVLGVACFLVCCIAAVPLGLFFHSEALPRIVVVLGTTFPLSAFRIVPNALLQKDLRFRRLALLETINVLVLSITMVLLARAGFGYWTLVTGALLSAVVTTALTVASRPQSFGWPKRADIAPALSFTRYQLGSTLLWYWYQNADQVVAGRLLGVGDLGVYTMAASTASSISDKIMMLLTRTTPAYFAALQDQPAALKRYLLRLTEILSVVLFPVLIGFALVADGFVRLALGPKWLGAIGPLRLLAISAAINSTTPLLARVLTVRGQNRYLLQVSVVLSVLLPISFVVGSHWGPAGIAAVWVTVFPLTRIPVLTRAVPAIGVSKMEYLRAFRPATNGILAMAVAVLSVRALLPAGMPLVVSFAVQVALGACVYFAVIFGFHRARIEVLLQLARQWRSGGAATSSAAAS